MKTFFDCIPCFVRQALDSIRLLTPDETVHEHVLREVLRAASEMDLRQTPPAMGQQIHREIRKMVGRSDPYRQAKDRFNRMALEFYPKFKKQVECSAHPMESAVRFAIAGNIIDLGVKTNLEDAQVHDSIERALSDRLNGDIEEFSRAVSEADDILYLADNAGEIVFDRLLIERLPPGKVTVAVRGFPVINDATLVDAEVAGIPEVAEVIDNGSDAPGTILDDCSDAFRERFDEADLIIAKGQGNYETLGEVDKNIYFLLKAKCPVIARDIGCQVGSMVLQRSTSSVAPAGNG
jgi:uncharacterized protein with ATP-grasp and redox domains